MSLDLVAYLAAVAASLAAGFPAVPTVEEYPRLRRKIVLPAILLELVDTTPSVDPGTGEVGLLARFAARVVLDQAPRAIAGDPDAEPPVPAAVTKPDLEALRLAAAVAVHVREHAPFGEPAGAPSQLRIEPDHFRPELAEYAVWRVEWSHDVTLGASVWDGAGVLPTHVYLGCAPEIGLGHEADYFEVTPVGDEEPAP